MYTYTHYYMCIYIIICIHPYISIHNVYKEYTLLVN